MNGFTYEPTESAYIESNGRTIGVETCYDITSANIENCLTDVEIHVNMKKEEGSGLTSSTGKTNGSDGDIALDLTCPSIRIRQLMQKLLFQPILTMVEVGQQINQHQLQ